MWGKLTRDKKIQMWYELKWELRVAQREASVWNTWRRRDSHGEAKKRQRPVSDRQCGPPTQRVSGHPWGVRAKEGQTWPLSSCRRLAQSGTRNQSWVCLWVHVWSAQDPSWYWFYCSVLLKRTCKTQNIFKNCPTSHRLTIDGGCCEGSQQGKCALLLLFCFFFLCEWLTTSCWHQSCRVGEWRTPIESQNKWEKPHEPLSTAAPLAPLHKHPRARRRVQAVSQGPESALLREDPAIISSLNSNSFCVTTSPGVVAWCHYI